MLLLARGPEFSLTFPFFLAFSTPACFCCIPRCSPYSRLATPTFKVLNLLTQQSIDGGRSWCSFQELQLGSLELCRAARIMFRWSVTVGGGALKSIRLRRGFEQLVFGGAKAATGGGGNASG